jgi:hypothetical protein
MSSKDPEAQQAATAAERRPLVDRTAAAAVQNDPDDPTKPRDEGPSYVDDAKDTVVLAVPIFLSMLSFVGMKTTDSALLGHVSAQALAAAALSDLVRTE